MTDIQNTMELCSKIFISWHFNAKENPNMDYEQKDKEFLEQSFIAKILLKKFEVYNIKIHLPVHLLMILSLCTNENPGQSQIVLKDLLNDIKSRRGPIPSGYVITPDDFALCFASDFPIMDISYINDKYQKLWNDQKFIDLRTERSENACDTIEYWKEVMK